MPKTLELKYLKQINPHFYSFFHAASGMLFTLKYGDRGVYGMGKAWYLSVAYSGEKQSIATFTIKDDGHRCYLDDYDHRLWSDEKVVISLADEMIGRMIG